MDNYVLTFDARGRATEVDELMDARQRDCFSGRFLIEKSRMYFIDSTNFERLLKKLSSEGELFVPVRDQETGKLHIERVEAFPLPEQTTLEGHRAVETLKAFGQLLRFPVAEYPSPELDELTLEENIPNYIVVGARACDIKAMELVDRVQIEGEFTDPFYKIRRDKMVVIGADCTDCGKSCFCNLLGGKPWPERGFDLSLSRVVGGYLIEAGSERGEGIVEGNKELFAETREGLVEQRDEIRREVLRKLEENNEKFPTAEGLPEIIRGSLTDEIWDEIAARCVECGACTNICPTCYCFLLYDQEADGEHFQRISTWDSCQVTGYARMAGMLNPRPRLVDRFKHRYYHKYDYLVLSHDAIYCTGCGRCIDSCSAGIDMRDVFERVKKKAATQGRKRA
ncbi:MAG: 4Fe-4S dicluster domain-containing protein [Candidatus Krumholzibacteria bacterium]|nr:4Fe-4S dicluster domain-containing protein [Candidatus Krumholzibacteria bacterium]